MQRVILAGSAGTNAQPSTSHFREKSMELLNFGEAAKRVRVCKRTFCNLVTEGRGPKVTKIGGKVFVADHHLREWVNSCAA